MTNRVKRMWNQGIFVCLLAILLVFCFNAVNTKAEDNGSDFEAYYSDEVGEAVKAAIESEESDVFVLFAEKEDLYSRIVEEAGFDRLGGAYYDAQGRLHILRKESADMKKADAVEFMFDEMVEQIKNTSESEKAEQLDEWVFMETCKYSYNELMKYKDIVCHTSCYSADKVFAVGIDDSINKINVHTVKGTDLSVLYTLVPEDAMNIILYGEGGEKVEFVDLESYTAYCGSGLINDSKGGAKASLACSVGWDLSTSQPKYGYLTAGHFASTVNDMIGLIIFLVKIMIK